MLESDAFELKKVDLDMKKDIEDRKKEVNSLKGMFSQAEVELLQCRSEVVELKKTNGVLLLEIESNVKIIEVQDGNLGDLSGKENLYYWRFERCLRN